MKERIVLQDARDEGKTEESFDRIRNMLSMGKTVEEIVDFCGYPVELVKKVEESMLAATN